jgi:type I restriction enzyme S subunit
MKSESDGSSNFEIDADDLPDGWILSTFGEIADVVAGGTPTASDETNFSDEGYPWITPADLSNYDSVYIQHGRRSLSKKGLQTSAAKMLPKGTVLMSSRAPIGYVAIAANPISTNQGFKNFICHEGILPEYVYYWIKYLNPYLEGMGSGSTFAEISGTRAKKIPFIYPPLAEQQRIVARVEALLTHVNAARDQLSRVPLIMKRFRQAVLAAACSGRLTEGWREKNPDVESGSQLLERLSESRKKIKKIGKTFEDNTFFEKFPELPITWTWSTIQQLSERVTVGHVGPMKNEYRSDGIPFLRCQNVRENYFDAKGLVFISPQFHESLKKSALEPGDLVVVRSGNVGVCCIIPESLTEANCSDLVVVKKPFGFVPKFGAYYVNSLAQNWIDLGTVGIALSHFNTKSVATLPIPIPPLAEQYEIVRRVGLLFERADAFDREVLAASRRCERLTQAVLGKAFAGKL